MKKQKYEVGDQVEFIRSVGVIDVNTGDAGIITKAIKMKAFDYIYHVRIGNGKEVACPCSSLKKNDKNRK